MTVKQEEFNKSFKAQQQLLLEEIRLLRIEHEAYNKGELPLPEEFEKIVGNELTGTVYLRVRNGDACVFLLDYKDHGRFHVQIFDGNTVEIDYPLRPIQYHKVCDTGRDRKFFSPTEIEKLEARFFYNAMGDSRLSDRVLPNDVIARLNVHEQMTWVQLCLNKSTWIINLKWENGNLLFNKVWTKFCEYVNLKEGDVCVFSRIEHSQRLKISIIDNDNDNELKTEVHGSGISAKKCFKMVSHDMLHDGNLELPSKFIDTYGSMLGDKVRLSFGDGWRYIAKFSKHNKSLFDLDEVFNNYSVRESFWIFFNCVGPSSLYLTIFSINGMDILHSAPAKVSLKELGKRPCFEVTDMSTSDSDSSGLVNEISSGGNQIPGILHDAAQATVDECTF
ncbi:uncharacterized protein LOC141696242 [Apium graveolens]|uniref:uncharacterized protein LOC141696242 n=1 Tax=Apium graveolens TaxID=4045 RepID=UPI003D7BB436